MAGDTLPAILPALPALGSIQGTISEDLDGNGSPSPNEPGMAGVAVYIDSNGNRKWDQEELSTFSQRDDPATKENESGRYAFVALPEGLYTVRQIVPEGYRQTFPYIVDGAIGDPQPDPPRVFDEHVVYLNPGQTRDLTDFANQKLLNAVGGSVSGLKWLDRNRNSKLDDAEQGIAGVTIYADLNGDGQLNANEPFTTTRGDQPETDFNESGEYTLKNLPTGWYSIRELVPTNYEQTFPGVSVTSDDDPKTDPTFATVTPAKMALDIKPSDVSYQRVSIAVHPYCFAAIAMGVQSSSPHVKVDNLTGTDINGCGGDLSEFKVAITTDGMVSSFDIQFIDVNSGSIYGTIPVTLTPVTPPQQAGGHLVQIQTGSQLFGYNFGNAPLGGASIKGSVWSDKNGNGLRDLNELGQAGLMVYLDLNDDGRFDKPEPWTLSERDNPLTKEDEGGRFAFVGLEPGEYSVRQIGPADSKQTLPGLAGIISSSNNVRLKEGRAIDLQLNQIQVTSSGNDSNVSARLDMTVVFPDSCGVLQSDPSFAIVGSHILVSLTANQQGAVCLDVITSRKATIDLGNLPSGAYDVITSLLEPSAKLGGSQMTLANLSTVELGVPSGYHFTLTKDQVVEGIEFGNQSLLKPGEIRGYKWLDTNANGVWDADETGLAGVTIYLDLNFNGQSDPGELSVVTAKDNPDTQENETGRFLFADVEPGYYQVREVVPQGYQQTFPASRDFFDLDPLFPDLGKPSGDGSYGVVVPSGGAAEKLLFGNTPVRPPGYITGVKWSDDNGDGDRDPSEKGLGGVVIFVDLNLNGKRDPNEPVTRSQFDNPSTDFDESGLYVLSSQPGEQLVLEESPGGYQQTYPSPYRKIRFPYNLGQIVNVIEGDKLTDVDFGNQPLAANGAVTGEVWLDTNGNRRRDADEPMRGGVVVYADLDRNGQLDMGEPATRSHFDDPKTLIDETGFYDLKGLASQKYLIRQVVPSDMIETYPANATGSIDAASNNLPPGRAISFEVVDIQTLLDGVRPSITFLVVWPDGCGQITSDSVTLQDGNSHVHIDLYSKQTGDICTMALKPEKRTVSLPSLLPDTFTFDATLWESLGNALPAFEQSFVLKGRFSRSTSGEHSVFVDKGQTVSNIDFGVRHDATSPPVALTLGDYNGDGKLDHHDADLVSAAIFAKGGEAFDAYDLSLDGKVDMQDLETLVKDVAKARKGDVNLDGRFDSTDLVRVFQAGKFETDAAGKANWLEGDWNGDGRFTSADLVAAMQSGLYGDDSKG